jgi:hypothetical protein
MMSPSYAEEFHAWPATLHPQPCASFLPPLANLNDQGLLCRDSRRCGLGFGALGFLRTHLPAQDRGQNYSIDMAEIVTKMAIEDWRKAASRRGKDETPQRETLAG